MPQYFGKLPVTTQPWSTLGDVKAVQTSDRHLTVDCGDGKVRLSLLSPRLVRVRMTAQSDFRPRQSWAVTREDDAWEPFPVEVEHRDDAIVLHTEQMHLQIQRYPCRITGYDQQGQSFAQDSEMGMGWRMGEVAAWKQIAADEHFYGFGERSGLLDKRSEVKTNWTVDALDYNSTTDEMYQAIPFFMALRPGLAYGILLNVSHWSQFDLGAKQSGIWQMNARCHELDYYIIYGPTPADILETYTHLTGRMPLPPKWALGYHQCRWSYSSADEVRRIATEFRDRQIPCDVIHLDIDYMQGYRVFTWGVKRFPDPAGLLQELNQNGFKTVTIVDPGVKYEPDGDYLPYHEGLEKDYFVRGVDGRIIHGYVWPDKAVFPDFLRPDVREWWGNWHHTLTEVGVAGIWNDMNEPALSDRPFGDEGDHIWFPLDAPQGPVGEGGTHAETHNLYGLNMARSAAEALERLRSDRSFVLTRSGFAGIQRWSAVWTGDNHSLWPHLEMSLPMICNLGLSGVAFSGADIGGFAGNATAELFARWMQAGMLYPFMRAHSSLESERHEPWVFGDRVEAICREYISLRYQLLPYLYTLFWEASQTGAPILRPLLYHYPNDPKTYALHDQVLLGPSLLAAPICRPGVEARAVYLPEGDWYDWWSGDRHTGSAPILAVAPLERMPLYVKAGAIIPMQPAMQHTAERSIDPLRLRIWPGRGEFTLYEDDGSSFTYRQGAWATTSIQVSQDGDQVIVAIASREGHYTPPHRTVIVDVIGRGEQQYEEDGRERRFVF